MGYTARQVEAEIFIPKKGVDAIGRPKLFEEQSGWKFFENDSGDIIEIYFVADKPMQEDIEFLKGIAPHTKDGSYVELFGEDGLRWRWVIDSGKVWEQQPEIKWKAFRGPL